METISMLLNRNFVAVSLLWLSGCISTPTWASDVCPAQDHQPLQSVEIYDGPVEDLALLMPDEGKRTHGYWLLGYVYDAHRSITVRCKYADGRSADVKLGKRVERCDYRFDRRKNLTLRCQR